MHTDSCLRSLRWDPSQGRRALCMPEPLPAQEEPRSRASHLSSGHRGQPHPGARPGAPCRLRPPLHSPGLSLAPRRAPSPPIPPCTHPGCLGLLGVPQATVLIQATVVSASSHLRPSPCKALIPSHTAPSFSNANSIWFQPVTAFAQKPTSIKSIAMWPLSAPPSYVLAVGPWIGSFTSCRSPTLDSNISSVQESITPGPPSSLQTTASRQTTVHLQVIFERHAFCFP